VKILDSRCRFGPFLVPLAAVIALFTACESGPVGEVIAKVGEATLTAQELERRVPIHLNGRVTADDRQRMVEAWVEEQLLYQDALTRKLDEDLTVTRRVDQATQSIVTSELLERSFSSVSAVSEEDLRAYYAEHSERFGRNFPELRARQILIKRRADASRVKKRLSGGAMFDQVAREESLDASREQGGDVGYFTEDRVDPAFWAGCEKAKIGKLTQIYTPLGYHLVEVLDRREVGSVRELLEVRDEIRQQILSERRAALRIKMIEDIRNRIPATIFYEKLSSSE
jgi:peptidyl-prolyl cis-trans isomerase C